MVTIIAHLRSWEINMYLDNLLIRSVSTEEEPIDQVNKKNNQVRKRKKREKSQRVGENADGF